jgi:hypothetical protein
LNAFVGELRKTGLFDKVEIGKRLTTTADDIAVTFSIRATLKEDQQADLLP